MTKQIKRDENIRLADGRMATLSAVQLPDGMYETMLYTNGPEMEEVASEQTDTEIMAVAVFNRLRDYYHIPELKGRYKKLADDLKDALDYGLERMGTDDGGTCNFDAPTIRLPGWNSKMVEAAAKVAGTGCFTWNFGGKHYVFSVRGAGQGYTRTRAAEAMEKRLRSLGYDAGMYYQAD